MAKIYTSLSAVIENILSGNLDKRCVMRKKIIAGTNFDTCDLKACGKWAANYVSKFEEALYSPYYAMEESGLYSEEELKRFDEILKDKWNPTEIIRVAAGLVKEFADNEVIWQARQHGQDNIYLPFRGAVSTQELIDMRDSYREEHDDGRVDWVDVFLAEIE